MNNMSNFVPGGTIGRAVAQTSMPSPPRSCPAPRRRWMIDAPRPVEKESRPTDTLTLQSTAA